MVSSLDLTDISSGPSTNSLRAAEHVSRFRNTLGAGMNEILPNLFLGSLRDATDNEQLERNRIKCIISIHDMTRATHPAHRDLHVMRIRMADSPGETISDHFAEAVRFIHEARIRGDAVLVHCLAGVSRSATIVAAYLIIVCDLSFYNAISFMSARRPAANPNFGFRMQLNKYADKSASLERDRLRHEFGEDFSVQWKKDRKDTHSKIVTQLSSTCSPRLLHGKRDRRSSPLATRQALMTSSDYCNDVTTQDIDFIDQ